MSSPTPCPLPSSSWWRWSLFALFAAPPPVRDGFFISDDALHCASRHDKANEEGVHLEIMEQCGDAELEQGEAGETLRDEEGCCQEALVANKLITHRFVLDSGAPFHATRDEALFASNKLTSVSRTGGGVVYGGRDGRALMAAGVGDISYGEINLPGVRYVPGLGAGVTLVSVAVLVSQGFVVFGSGRCHIRDQRSGQVVGKGRLRGDDGLYHLDFLSIPPSDGVAHKNIFSVDAAHADA